MRKLLLLSMMVMCASACAIEPDEAIIEDQVSQLAEPELGTELDELVADDMAEGVAIAATCHGTVTCNRQVYSCATESSPRQECGAQRCGSRCGGPVCQPDGECRFSILQPVEVFRSCRRVVSDPNVPEFCTEWQPAGTVTVGCGGELCS